MRVGILGSGVVGQTLGTAFAEHGHAVTIGSKSPEKDELRKWKAATGRGAATATFADTANGAEVVVVCCLGSAVDAVIDLAGPEHFAGKLVIDATNQLDFSAGGAPGLLYGTNDSLGERVQRRLPGARVVKCFNTVPAPVMVHPRIGNTEPDMFIAGNDAAAKAEVVGILKSFGWSGAIDLGGIENARWLEALVPLWVRSAMTLGNFQVAFKVVR
jgi:8-hydroxy-5-deazaflavin:NADPH oxidoreductase